MGITVLPHTLLVRVNPCLISDVITSCAHPHNHHHKLRHGMFLLPRKLPHVPSSQFPLTTVKGIFWCKRQGLLNPTGIFLYWRWLIAGADPEILLSGSPKSWCLLLAASSGLCAPASKIMPVLFVLCLDQSPQGVLLDWSRNFWLCVPKKTALEHVTNQKVPDGEFKALFILGLNDLLSNCSCQIGLAGYLFQIA
jgi:hypothetical protein